MIRRNTTLPPAGYDAVDPDIIIEDDMAHEQPPKSGENRAKWHQRALRTVDRVIRSAMRSR